MSRSGPPNDPSRGARRRSLVTRVHTDDCGGVLMHRASRLLAVLCGCLVAACGVDPSAAPGSSPSAVLPDEQQIRPGVAAAVTEPGGPAEAVVVVLVPGGGWVSADPSGLAPLAEHLASRGAVVVTLRYRTATEGAYFPEPALDIECGIAFASTAAGRVLDDRGLGDDPTIAVVGHSAGAQLSAVAALSPTTLDPGCPYPSADADALIGLAGPYDVVAAERQAVNLFGPEYPRLDQWDAGNPIVLASQRPELPVLLLHGEDDPLVPVAASETFAQALDEGGHPVELDVLAGVDHDSVYSAEVAGPVISSWLQLDAPEGQASPPAR